MTRSHLTASTRESCEVTAVPQFAGLPAETRERLQRICKLRHFKADQVVGPAGEKLDQICCVQRGIVRMQKTLQDGRQQIVGLLVEGDIFGRVFDGPLTFTLEAVTGVDVIAFRRTPFEALLLESPELERLVLLNLLNEVDRARDWLIILANPRIRGRLAGFLTVLCTRFAKIGQLLKVDEQTIEVRIPLSRVDLAHLLGTRPETISRAFHALADKGIIAIKRPDLIVVRDIDGLIAEAGEDGTDLKVSLRALLLATVRPKERGAARHRSSARGTGSPRP